MEVGNRKIKIGASEQRWRIIITGGGGKPTWGVQEMAKLKKDTLKSVTLGG